MSEVEESAEYENFLGEVNEEAIPEEPTNLLGIMGIEEDETEETEWKKNWVGMPEFEQEDNEWFKKLVFRLRSEEDYKQFAALVNQRMTNKTKSMWYPELDRTANTVLRWVEE